MSNDKLRMTPLAREIDAAAEKLEEIEARLGTPNERANDLELARVYGHDLRNLLTKLHGQLFAIANQVVPRKKKTLHNFLVELTTAP